MIKPIALISFLTTAVLAQSSSSSSASATSTAAANPLIPTGVSASCTTFFQNLNSNTTLTSCTSSLISATSAFAPGSNTTATAAAVSSALNNLCSASAASSCPDSLIRGTLADFYTACSNELATTHNSDVIRTYDVLYAISPLRTSICAKDDGGNYCVLNATAPTGSLSKRTIVARGDSNAVVPNITAYSKSNMPFIFIQPTFNSSTLCVTCTRNVLTAYIKFESDVPYAPGFGNSQLLGSQTALYSGVQSTCGSAFLSGTVQAAGGISEHPVGNAASGAETISSRFNGVAALVMFVVTLAVSSAL